MSRSNSRGVRTKVQFIEDEFRQTPKFATNPLLKSQLRLPRLSGDQGKHNISHFTKHLKLRTEPEASQFLVKQPASTSMIGLGKFHFKDRQSPFNLNNKYTPEESTNKERTRFLGEKHGRKVFVSRSKASFGHIIQFDKYQSIEPSLTSAMTPNNNQQESPARASRLMKLQRNIVLKIFNQ